MTDKYCSSDVGDKTESFVLVEQETSFHNQLYEYQQVGFNEIEVEEVKVFAPLLHDPLALVQEDEDPLSFNCDLNSQTAGESITNESIILAASSTQTHIVATRSDVEDIEGSISKPSELTFDKNPMKLEPTSDSQALDPMPTTCITYVAFKPTQKTFLCTPCGIPFYSDAMFQKHRNQFHGENLKHSCRHCGKKFRLQSELKRHATIHDPKRWKGKPKYACDFCEKAYHLKVSLDGHRREKHLGYVKPKFKTNLVVRHHHAKGVRNPRPAPKAEKKLHPCPYCDLLFEHMPDVRKHLVVHSNEKKFKCEFCEQPFKTRNSLRTHVNTVHLNPNPLCGPRSSRPKFMAHQPCPCTICGKVFKLPSKLKIHMTLHTGEKPHECDICGKPFRLTQDLKSHKLYTHSHPDVRNRFKYKCMVCGKDNFRNVCELTNHRVHVHWHIPYDSDKEKAFACGICGKPWFLKEQAMVCAVLGHDPASLLKQMFRIRCPACPKEQFWHRSTYAVRKHWEEEHQGQTLPAALRRGMYQTQPVADPLPYVVINKEMKDDILENGCKVKYEYPLYVQLDLVDVTETLKAKNNDLKESSNQGKLNCKCTICGRVMHTASNLRRHMAVHEKDKLLPRMECPICNEGFRKKTAFRLHQKVHETEKRKRGRPRKNPIASNAIIQQTINAGTSSNQLLKPLSFQDFDSPSHTWNNYTVSCNDADAVAKILGNKTAQLVMTKCDAADHSLMSLEHKVFENVVSVNLNDTYAVQIVLRHRSLSIVLFRC